MATIVGTELVKTITLPGSDGVYEVTVTYGPDAGIPENATLQVAGIEKGSDKYEEARARIIEAKKAQDAGYDETHFNMEALDITILDENGVPVEPAEGAPVTVSIRMKEIPAGANEDSMADSLEVYHLNESSGEPVAEAVAENRDVTVEENGAEAEFTVDSFSTFALTWDDGTSYIHWGTMKNGAFEEWDKSAIDTSTGNFSLRTLYDDYVYSVAVYYGPSEDPSDPNAGTEIESAITKNSDGTWQYQVQATEDTTGTIADGSHIYVYYVNKDDIPETEAPTIVPSTVEDPLKTTKSVVPNKNTDGTNDGTYKITLSITGDVVSDTHTVASSANVIVVLDVSTSMNQNLSSGETRLAAAKTAANTLVDAMPNAAGVDMAVISFGGTVSTTQSWLTITSDTQKTTIKNKITALGTNQGTNWTDALSTAKTLADNKKASGDTDPTYIIFLTDGCPTTNKSGHNHGSNGTQLITDTCISDPLATMTAMVGAGYNVYGIYANTAGDSTRPYSGSGYGRVYTGDSDPLKYVIRMSGAAGYYMADNASALNQVFTDLAQTITNNLGYSNTSIDDGITSLTSVEASVSVSGAAGNFEYSRSGGSYGTGTPWTDAPTASASGSGVTWDLSSIGNLEKDVTYTVSFDIWPSQEALDLVADLNNGLVDYDDLDPSVQAQIEGSQATGYTLLTNTYLHTNYTYSGEDYMYNADKGDGAMSLSAETISLKKNWPANMLDSYGAATYRDENGEEQTATSIDLTVTKDGANYMVVNVGAENGWKRDNIYISCGIMTIKNGEVKIAEPGYDYTVTEPTGFSYYWDLIAPIYHPMIINGTTTLLVLDKSATTADNVDTFSINGKIYRKLDEGATLEADNYRRSNLNLTKKVEGSNAPEDAWFTYSVTVKDAESTDGQVWFSAWDPKTNSTVKDTSWVISGATAETDDSGNTGYWYATNGAAIKLKIKAGWNVRFLNLKHDSTFSFEEIEPFEDGFEFKEAEVGVKYALSDTQTQWYTVDGALVTGKILEPNNSYTATYTNTWVTIDVQLEKVDENGDHLTGSEFTLDQLVNGNWTQLLGEIAPGADYTKTEIDEETGEETEVSGTYGNPFDLGGLGIGRYMLTESAAPDGYLILSKCVYFEVYKDEGGTLKTRFTDADGNEVASMDEATISSSGPADDPVYTIKIENVPGSELPMTGGVGTMPYTVCGLMLAVLSAAVIGFTDRIKSRRSDS